MDKSNLSDGSEVDQVRSRASTNDLGQGSVNGEAMQGVEAAPTPRQGAWAAINSVSPKFETDDRAKCQGPAYQYNPTYQQSPPQNSNPPSLISASNGDSTPGIHSPYAASLAYASLPQHVSNLPGPTYGVSMAKAGVSMGPPGNQGWTDDQNEQWLYNTEQITMSNAGFDNYVQDESFPMEFMGSRNNFFGFLQGIEGVPISVPLPAPGHYP